MKKQQCPICGQFEQEHKIKPVGYTYKNESFTINQPAMWCDACGEGIIGAEDNKAVMQDIQSERARIDGLLTPQEIKKVRTRLKFTQKEAGTFFGGGVNAFSRYEKGITPISKPLSYLLEVLDENPGQLRELINRHHFSRVSRPNPSKKSKMGLRFKESS